MTYRECRECGGAGGWTHEDGERENCPTCHSWGHVNEDDGDWEDSEETALRILTEGGTVE